MIQYPPKEFWKHFKETRGAMSTAEAIFMYNACLQVPNDGVWVEMGTAYGKSALVSLMAWHKRELYDLYLLEPEFNKDDFFVAVNKAVSKFRNEFGSETFCIKSEEYSTGFLPKHDRYGYIMWDSGDHGEDLVQAEKKLFQEKVISGGIIVLHDLFSQFTAVTRAYEQLVATGQYEAITFDWNEIFEYVKEHDLENGNDSWHQYPELTHPPNFIGALRRK